MKRFNNILRVKVPSVVDINEQWRRNKASKPTDSMTVVSKDVLRLKMQAGDGGNGIPRYNGIGGSGGSIVLIPKTSITFKQLCKNYELNNIIMAEAGQNSLQTKLVGKNAKDLVPLGVECVDEGNILLARCSQAKPFLIAKGGQGGSASNNYRGEKGEVLDVFVHLKLRPNVGMIGFPNAGKSTLLKALVPQKPIKIASYPFTTVNPQLCYLNYKDDKKSINENNDLKEVINLDDKKTKKKFEDDFTLSIADLPGIIEGASRNKGRGYSFLKHLEYSDIILMIVDVYGFQLTPTLKDEYRTALETIALLNREMELYHRKLVIKPCVLVLNKIDLPNGQEKADELVEIFKEYNKKDVKWIEKLPIEIRPQNPINFINVISISAKKRKLGELKSILKKIYQELHPLQHVIFEEEILEKSQKSLI